MRINNNDLIETALKRIGFELDRPFKLKINDINEYYEHSNWGKEDSYVFKFSKKDGEIKLYDGNGDSFEFYYLIFDNKIDLKIEFVGDKEEDLSEIKARAEREYSKCINTFREYKNINPSPYSLISSIARDYELRRYVTLCKLDVLRIVLGYSLEKVKTDVESEE